MRLKTFLTIMRALLIALKLVFLVYFLRNIDGIQVGHKSEHTKWVKLDNASMVICRNEVQRLQCENYEGIFIQDAFWGRSSSVICQKDKLDDKCSDTETCIPEDTKKITKRVEEACHGFQDCWLLASPIFFRFDEEDCPTVCKYLQVNYACKHMSGMKKTLIGKPYAQ